MFNSDSQLVRKCLHGKPGAFGVLYDRHAPRVFRLLRHLSGSDTEAEDLTQETFLAAHQGLGAWRGEGAFGTWLCGIAYKRYASRRRTPVPDCDPLDAHPEFAASEGDPLLHCTRREREQRIAQAIADLPDVCREVFVLVKVDGLAYRHAAELLNVPVGTVQSRLWRATRLLQSVLASDNPHEATQRAQRQATNAPILAAMHNAADEENETLEAELRQGGKPHVVRDCA